jgi:hypothetical protein
MPRYASGAWVRKVVNLYVPLPGGTGPVVAVLSLPVGRCVLEKMEVVPAVAGTGAGATRTLNVRKGSATGTVVATANPTLANMGTVGTFLAGTVTASAAAFEDADVLSVEFANGGTAFTAGAVNLVLTFRERGQRDA